MYKHPYENKIADLDILTFSGVLMMLTGIVLALAIVVTGIVDTLGMWVLAATGAATAVCGHALASKGLGYKAVSLSVKHHASLWLFIVAVGLSGGSIMI